MAANALSQFTNLAKVMSPVNAMEASPLVGREWSQARVVDQFHATTESLLAFPNAFVHRIDVLGDPQYNLLGRKTLGQRSGRCLPSRRQIPKPRDHKSAQAILGCRGTRRGFSRLQATIKYDFRTAESEGQMLKNLSDAPFPICVPGKFVDGDAGGLLLNQVRKLLLVTNS
jgi:hypothetical protein